MEKVLLFISPTLATGAFFLSAFMWPDQMLYVVFGVPLVALLIGLGRQLVKDFGGDN